MQPTVLTPVGFPVLKNALCCEYMEATNDILENLFCELLHLLQEEYVHIRKNVWPRVACSVPRAAYVLCV